MFSEEELSLQPLQDSPYLLNLTVIGASVTDLDGAKHLTLLSLFDCDAQCSVN